MNDVSELYLPELQEELVDAARRHYQAADASSSASLRLRRFQRWRPLALIAVLCLAGATGALAAAGVFKAGSPVSPDVPATPTAYTGVAVAGTVLVLALRVRDPAGGPPWGLRLDRTTRGYVCVQPGRVDFGKVGALGIDDAFANDDRFHPFSSNYQETLGCATADTHGAAFVSVDLKAVPDSAMESSCQRRLASVRANRGHPICPAGTMRDLSYGMLGPDAVSATYANAAGKLVTSPTSGPDGAFLIVGHAASYCTRQTVDIGAHRSQLIACGDESVSTTAFAGVIRAVTYRDGHTCGLPDPATPNGACPSVGYSGSPTGAVTAAQVASPVTVHNDGLRYWCGNGHDLQVCGTTAPPGFHRQPASAHIQLTVSFIARVAVSNSSSDYVLTLRAQPSTPGCGGSSGQPLGRDVRVGERVEFRSGIPTPTGMPEACVGTIRGSVVYTTDAAPADSITGPLGHPVQVGHFSLRLR
jgi:hypothetical protein